MNPYIEVARQGQADRAELIEKTRLMLAARESGARALFLDATDELEMMKSAFSLVGIDCKMVRNSSTEIVLTYGRDSTLRVIRTGALLEVRWWLGNLFSEIIEERGTPEFHERSKTLMRKLLEAAAQISASTEPSEQYY